MKKQFIILSAFLILLGGCNQEGNVAPKKIEIKLTEEEVKEAGNNSNIGAQILVKKAILKEMSEVKYTEEEKKELESIKEKMKEEIEMEYFLNKKAMETTNVDDMEVLEVYQNNIEKLKNIDIVEVLPQLKEQMLLNKREQEKVNYMNSLVGKYDLNNILAEYFPGIKKDEAKVLPQEEKKEEVKNEIKEEVKKVETPKEEVKEAPKKEEATKVEPKKETKKADNKAKKTK